VSGETAGFLAGGEFPIPSGQDSSGNITLQLKSFGVSLNFTPTVLSEDHISLQMLTEVSEKSAENSVTLASITVPGLSVRRAETTVQMSSGGTIMIAGLIKSTDTHNLTGFPGVKDLPILGELFKSKSFTRDESELVILVTPYLVQPFADPKAIEVSDDASVPYVAPSGAGAPLKHSAYVPAVPVSPVSATRLSPAPLPRATASSMERPLSQSFVANLKKVYGGKAPQDMPGGPSFGYIVD